MASKEAKGEGLPVSLPAIIGDIDFLIYTK
jgi:hypothetical protein